MSGHEATIFRCECSGQCGATHGWTAAEPKRRCNAPSGCRIVRKKDQPSYWQLAAGDWGGALAYPELYRTDKPVEVALKPVTVPGADGAVILACQMCRKQIRDTEPEPVAAGAAP